MNHPPFITINGWYKFLWVGFQPSKTGGLWHCYTHISTHNQKHTLHWCDVLKQILSTGMRLLRLWGWVVIKTASRWRTIPKHHPDYDLAFGVWTLNHHDFQAFRICLLIGNDERCFTGSIPRTFDSRIVITCDNQPMQLNVTFCLDHWSSIVLWTATQSYKLTRCWLIMWSSVQTITIIRVVSLMGSAPRRKAFYSILHHFTLQ